MALGGLHKDSILDLVQYAQEQEAQEESEIHEVRTELEDNEIYNENTVAIDAIAENNIDYKIIDEKKIEDVKVSEPPQYYSGFNQNFEEQYGSYYDPYAPAGYSNEENDSKEGGLFQCFFFFCSPTNKTSDEKEGNSSAKPLNTSIHEPEAGVEEAVTAMKNDSKGIIAETSQKSKEREKIVDEEAGKNQEDSRKDTKINNGNEQPNEDSTVTKITKVTEVQSDIEGSKSLKGILKTGRKSNDGKETEADALLRRSLFSGVEYENSFTKQNNKEKTSKQIQFAPMTRVLLVPGRHHFPVYVKKDIWWSHRDYEDFKKTGRIITRALLEGGSEIWLSSKSGYNLSSTRKEGEQSGDKWWCKFGHSRRGLEHIASAEEGRHRQANVTNSIKMVIIEQRRQKLYNMRNEERLSKVASKYTSFARDLALAAGAADAEAVRTNFRAKNRLHYKLLPNMKVFADEENVKSLDVYTRSARRVRQMESRDTNETENNTKETESSSSLEKQEEIEESVQDPVNEQGNIAKKAQDFGYTGNDGVAFIKKRTSSVDSLSQDELDIAVPRVLDTMDQSLTRIAVSN